jgi:hypothetical protein
METNMTLATVERGEAAPAGLSPSQTHLLRNCETLGRAVHDDLGKTVEEVQKLILRYYDNVRDQAEQSFRSAKRVATVGFVLLASTIAYVVFIDLMVHVSASGFSVPTAGAMNVGAIGLIGGGIVEAIAGTQFVLYGRATKQFGAFHICLERTHRYLVAYKMAETIGPSNAATLEKLVCIMANAPMITQQDIDGLSSGKRVPDARTGIAEALRNADTERLSAKPQ